MAHPFAVNINVPGTISHLNKMFGSAIQKLSYLTGIRTAVRGTEVYNFQVDYAYIINDVINVPYYIAPKFVQNAHELIRVVELRIEELKAVTE